MRFRWLALIPFTLIDFVAAAPSVINATAHADTFIAPAINAALGPGKVDNPIFVDVDLSANADTIIPDAINSGKTYQSVASGNPVNHAPYAFINGSICCYKDNLDIQNYATLVTQNTLYMRPIAVSASGPLPAKTPPPLTYVPASSPNSGNGGTGWGVEFGLSAGYKGLDTTEDSWVSAEVAGFFAALQFNHPTWNFFDLKAAFRQTASQWSSGYSPTQFGFGFLNWDSANAIASTSSLFLQGPRLSINNQGFYATITLYPFKQTRRTVELLYSVSASYVWPIKDEYVAADIAASGATLLFTSNGTDVTPQYTFVPSATGTVTFVAFTADGAGHYSRIESYSPMSASLLAGTACHQ